MVASFEASPVATVRSAVTSTKEMPLAGVPARVEVLPAFSEALRGIEEHSHVVLLCHINVASRDVLVARARKLGGGPERGVFASRSPARPNPISLCVTRLVRREGDVLHVDPLDMVDGTPVLDIKPYAYGWDCVFSARSPRPLIEPRFSADEVLADCLRIAANFHGDVCPGIVIGVRATIAALRELGIADPRGSKRLVVFSESDRCLADALMALTGCTPGKRTLRLADEGKMAATFLDTQTGRAVRAAPRAPPPSGDVSTREGREAAARRLAAMDERELIELSDVRLELRDEDRPGPPRASVRCASCGEVVRDGREVDCDGKGLCKRCAGVGYLAPLGR